MATRLWTSLYSAQITAASISFTASLAVVISVGAAGLKIGPYKRFIFIISVADILQSFALMVGPFAPPASTPQAFWSIGNQATCSASGFMFCFGATWFILNIAFLCFYYLCKIKQRMTDDMFSAKFEWKIHAFTITITLLGSLAGIGLGAINSAASGTFCGFAALPTGCRQNAELYGECVEPLSTHAANLIIFACVTIVVSLIGIISCMTSILWHVIIRDKIMRARSSSSASASAPTAKSQDKGTQPHCSDTEVQASTNAAHTDSREEGTGTPPHRSDTEIQADNLLSLYLKEITTQALLYTSAFSLCYAPIVILNVILLFDLPVSITFLTLLTFLVALFYPLNGLFTILIYTRPAVGHLRRTRGNCNPENEYSWLRAFVLVLKAGGEVPTVSHVDSNGLPIQEFVHGHEMIKSQPFGVANANFNVISSDGFADAISSGVEYTGSENEMIDCTGSALSRSDVDWNTSNVGGESEGKVEQGWPSGMSLSEAPSRISLPPGASVSDTGLTLSSEIFEENTKEVLPSTGDNILARALARTLQMGK